MTKIIIKFLFFYLLCSMSIGIAQNVPVLKIGGMDHQSINTDELILQGVSCVQQYDEIVSFSIFVETSKRSLNFPSKKNALSDEFIDYAPMLRSGDKIRFDSIRVKSKGVVVSLKPITSLISRVSPRCDVGKYKYAYELSMDDIALSSFLNCTPEYLKIRSFDLLIVDQEQVKRFSNLGAEFSPEIINEISHLNGGETIWFEHICATYKEDTLWVPPLKISILASNKKFPCTFDGISFGVWNDSLHKGPFELKVPSTEVKINSFTLSANVNGKNISFNQQKGKVLTEDMVLFIRKVPANTVIVIDHIFAEKEGIRLHLNPIYLRISGAEILPKATLGSLSFGEQTIENIVKNPKISVGGISVASFVVRTPDGHLFRSDRGEIEPLHLEIIKKLPKGTVLHFYNISFISNGKRIKTSDIWLKIK